MNGGTTRGLILGLVGVATLVGPGAVEASNLSWPVNGRTVRQYAVTSDRYAAGQHRGLDLAARPGSVVRSACAGRVTFAGSVGATRSVVTTRCGQYLVSYSRLGSPRVSAGTIVTRQTVLGTVKPSDAGVNTVERSVLHVGVRRVSDGEYVDPQGLFRTRAAPMPDAVPWRGPSGRSRRPLSGPDGRPASVPPAHAPAPFAVSPAPDAGPLAPTPVPWLALAGVFGLVLLMVPARTNARRRSTDRRGRLRARRAVSRRPADSLPTHG